MIILNSLSNPERENVCHRSVSGLYKFGSLKISGSYITDARPLAWVHPGGTAVPWSARAELLIGLKKTENGKQPLLLLKQALSKGVPLLVGK